MNGFSPSFERLIEQFRRLPSVGEKSAQRFAFHVLSMTEEEAETFAKTVLDARKKIKRCKICRNFTDEEICPICSSPSRDGSVVCVVEDPRDVAAIEKTREYDGLYHVLHGVVSPMNDVSPEDLCIKELISRLGGGEIEEVIMATDATVEGEATAAYISRLIKPLGVKVSRLAYGVPVGAELEYADEFTLIRALEGRREI